jgi:catechol 2,3-dioxygenase-like lactoylglutathione lyase family enzyme
VDAQGFEVRALLNGINHVAILTNDTERLLAFYEDVFDATTTPMPQSPAGSDVRMSLIEVGPFSELNVFQVAGNTEADRQVPMFGRGRIDHLALHAESLAAFEAIRDRLVARGASDGVVTDFGPILSLFFRDPDGLECEVCIENPDAQPGVFRPPGTPSARFHPDRS